MAIIVDIKGIFYLRDSDKDTKDPAGLVEVGTGIYRLKRIPNPREDPGGKPDEHSPESEWYVLADRPTIGAGILWWNHTCRTPTRGPTMKIMFVRETSS